MRLNRYDVRRVTLFTAAFVMLPLAAFAMVIIGMLWRRAAGIA
jgi:hypothetical protein